MQFVEIALLEHERKNYEKKMTVLMEQGLSIPSAKLIANMRICWTLSGYWSSAPKSILIAPGSILEQILKRKLEYAAPCLYCKNEP